MKHIRRAFNRKKEKGWPKLYIVIDMHETVITPTYNRLNEGARIYGEAIEVLQNWTKRPDISLIMWSPLHDDAREAVEKLLASEGIVFDYFCCNPEVPTDELCNFESKFYYDIGLCDKFGFNANTDWSLIKNVLIEIGEW